MGKGLQNKYVKLVQKIQHANKAQKYRNRKTLMANYVNPYNVIKM